MDIVKLDVEIEDASLDRVFHGGPSPTLLFAGRTIKAHYRNCVLCRMSKTLGKDYFTLGKDSVKISALGKDFVEYQKTLVKENTRQIKNRKN
jgi:hypothetical protein